MSRTRIGAVEFISYDGHFPCLCSGTLILKINGQERKLEKYSDNFYMCSGGSVSFDENWSEEVESGPWSVSLPDDLEPYKDEIEALVNDNVPWGCCGGCV